MSSQLPHFHSVTNHWFTARFGEPTPVQSLAWPQIATGNDILLSAPTGSGKTLAAFLSRLDALLQKAFRGELEPQLTTLYVSPLRALSSDIQKNLEQPLGELATLAEAQGYGRPDIRVAVRTGDTPVAERTKMGKTPPHILVTTPESLYILLTAEKSRQMLRSVETIIVDEIHALADDKRGAHLALSLERLEALATAGRPGKRIQRIGLSATQKPMDEIGRFLVGTGRQPPQVIDEGHRRPLDLGVEVPEEELSSVTSDMQWGQAYDRLVELAEAHRTTIIFCNTRRLCERIAHHLGERMGEEKVAPHHGSLSKKTRLDSEQRLKAGTLKVVVATASLELGIDVGSVDLVCQISSPRSIAVALQRVGRSGHRLGATPKGRFFALTRDDLIECTALIAAIRQGKLDTLTIPKGPLDIAAQQMVATCAAEELSPDELFALIRRAYPYRDLPRKAFDDLLTMLAEGATTRRGRVTAHLHYDKINARLRGRRGARLAAITSGGAIPDVADYRVIADPDEAFVGTVDEDFAVESMVGDIFLLGNTSWRVRRVESMGRIRVEDARGAPPSIPFWRGEAPSRTEELSAEVAELRTGIVERVRSGEQGRSAAIEWLMATASLGQSAAEQAVDYVCAGHAGLGAIPTQTEIVAERFFDEAGGMQLILHTPFGGRINRAWGLALRKKFCRSFDFELQAAATDEGILLSLGERHSFPLAMVFDMVHPDSVEEVLTQAILAAPMFGVRWRWNITRSLVLLRHQGGKRVPPPLQRIRAEELLAAIFPAQLACAENLPGGDRPVPDHPLVEQTVWDCLHEALDVRGLERVLGLVRAGAITCVATETPEPSVFSHSILNANPYAFLDDAPLEERRARAVALRRTLPSSAGDIGALDAEAIAEVVADAWPDVRSADELHDLLLQLGVVREKELKGSGAEFYPELESMRRVVSLRPRGASEDIYMAAERAAELSPLYIKGAAASMDTDFDRAAVVLRLVRDRMQVAGPVTAVALGGLLFVDADEVNAALHQLESEGEILRGRFTSGAFRGVPVAVGKSEAADAVTLEWCERNLLSRIHRRTLGRLRREIEPVAPADFLRFLFTWQHVAPGTKLAGQLGMRTILLQLQGFELPAAAWEHPVLASRMEKYDPAWLDRLCLHGELVWGRLSRRMSEVRGPRNFVRTANIGIGFRSDLPWLLAPWPKELPPLSHGAQEVLGRLEMGGASFFAELVAATGRLPAEVENALAELVANGLVTADGMDGLRTMLGDRKGGRRAVTRRASPRARAATGRWSLLRALPPPDSADAEATRIDRLCLQLLRRWGVLFRDLLGREAMLSGATSATSGAGPEGADDSDTRPYVPWRKLAQTLRRMEARGEIRGGRFVNGFVGEQFALPDAVDALRAIRRKPASGERVTVAAADPLNLVGMVTPGGRIAPTSQSPITYVDGVPTIRDDVAMKRSG